MRQIASILRPLRWSFVLLAAVASCDPLWAEHRVALLIDAASGSEPGAGRAADDAAPAFEKALRAYGFRTRRVTVGTLRELTRAIDSFVASAPTCGTALVHIHGRAVLTEPDDAPELVVAPPDLPENADRRKLLQQGLPVSSLLRRLHEDCGAIVNVVALDVEIDALDAAGDAVARAVDRARPDVLVLLKQNRTADGQSLLAAGVAAQPRGDLLAALRRSADVVGDGLPKHVRIEGAGTAAVAPPDRVVDGRRAGDEWVNPHGIVFCWCPPGSYRSFAGREVRFERGFWIGKYELTIREETRRHLSRDVFAREKNDPVTLYNLDDANRMARDMNRIFDPPPPWRYALCTEAEWEYAARAGTDTTHYFGENVAELPRHGNFADRTLFDTGDFYFDYAARTLSDGVARIARVGRFMPNPWGLHDVYGNVYEWCENGAIRGGSWVSLPEYCNARVRQPWPNRQPRNFIGYRLVLTANRPSNR